MIKKNVLAALILGTALALVPSVSQGQDHRSISPALALARICVSEANWDCFTTGDGYAIHEVLLRGSNRLHTSYVGFARAYAGATLGNRPYTATSNRQWVAELAEDGSAPAHWPNTPRLSGARGQTVRMVPAVPWTRYRSSWLAVLAKAREVVRLTLDNVREWSPCESIAEDWGGDCDLARSQRLGMIPVVCSGTKNYFYIRPNSPNAHPASPEVQAPEPSPTSPD